MFQRPRAPRLKPQESSRGRGMANPPPSDEETPSARTAKLLRSILTEEPPRGETGQASAAAEPLLPDVDSGPIVADPPPGSAVEWIDAVAEAVKEADERMSRELSAARGRALISAESAPQAEERAPGAAGGARAAQGRVAAGAAA